MQNLDGRSANLLGAGNIFLVLAELGQALLVGHGLAMGVVAGDLFPPDIDAVLAFDVPVLHQGGHDLGAQLGLAHIVLDQRHLGVGDLAIGGGDVHIAAGARENLVGEAGLPRVHRVMHIGHENLGRAVVELPVGEPAVEQVPVVHDVVGTVALVDEAFLDVSEDFDQPLANGRPAGQFRIAIRLPACHQRLFPNMDVYRRPSCVTALNLSPSSPSVEPPSSNSPTKLSNPSSKVR